MGNAVEFVNINKRFPGVHVLKDISFTVEEGEIHAAFVFILGEEPDYAVIEDGSWTSSAPYGTIHRIAGSGAGKGVFRECLAYCMSRISNIRIDTHRDNAIMRHLLEKHGFQECGIIYVEDGSPRIAYQINCQLHSSVSAKCGLKIP